MPAPRNAKSPARSDDAFARMAWAPSYRAPRAADVLRQGAFVPSTQPTWAELGAKDVVERDGRVESVSLAGRAFISLAGPLFVSNPPREVRLVAVKWYLDELAVCPHLARVESLNLAGNRIGDEGVRTLVGSPFLSPRHLDLSFNNLGRNGVEALRAAKWFTGLLGLKLAGNARNGMDEEWLRSVHPTLSVDTIA